MILLAALALLSQQDRTALRTEKGDYFPVLQRCRDGEAMIDSDPRGSIEKFDEILVNPKIKLTECRIRVEERPSEYTAYYAFLPYQYRGRAKINLARKSEPEAAQKLLTEAVADLERSVKEGVVEGNLKEGVKSSDDFLRVAKAELQSIQAKLKAPPSTKTADPAVEPAIVKFRPAFQRLLDDLKFKSARDLVESDGKGLSDAEKKKFKDEAESACRAYVDEQVVKLRRRLDLPSLKDLRALSARELETIFAAPKPEELVTVNGALDWARASLAAFEGVRSRRNPPESLLPVAASAAAIEPEGANPWFATAMTLAFEGVRDGVSACVARAADQEEPERAKERAAAEALHRQWSDFAGKLDPKVLAAHPEIASNGTGLGQLLQGFPVDLAELAKADLDACFATASPEAAFGRLEQSLKGLESGRVVTRESRRKLYDLLFTAAALRVLAEGKTEEAAASEAAGYWGKLRPLGGPVDDKKYGPRLQAVIAKLR